MAIKCHQIIEAIEKIAPKKFAEEWDNVGLQIGVPNMEVKNILITLDIDEEIVQEAITNNVNLIISHHPLIFSPIKNIRWDNHKGKLIKMLIQNEIAVYCAHTNLDNSNEGINTWLAKKIDISSCKILKPIFSEKMYKYVVFVPKSNIEEIKKELGKQGAGWIGNYSNCSFSTEGIGSFKPLEGTSPYIGKQDRIENVEEVRIETIIRQKDINRIIKAIEKIHPYEEVAYDIYPLENKAESVGLGVIGNLSRNYSTQELIEKVKTNLNVKHVKIAGPIPNEIKKIAICSGSGSSLITTAKYSGADVFITGDMKYHDAQIAKELGIFIIDPGHFATEHIVIDGLYNYLKSNLKYNKLNVNIIKSKENKDYISII